jgi:putative RNA 2'-phosphotransferase
VVEVLRISCIVMGMTDSERTRASKFLSLILRHKPETIGISLDARGWALVQDIIDKSTGREVSFTKDLLEGVVSNCRKQRFEFNEDCTRIRCRQGHSLDIELGLQATEPPEYLFHGTATRFLQSILAEGLKKQQRQHVHLSIDDNTATAVGSRYGKPVVLKILAGKMFRDGHIFYISANGVWLTDSVPPQYIESPS